jgi:hypothetical protein
LMSALSSIGLHYSFVPRVILNNHGLSIILFFARFRPYHHSKDSSSHLSSYCNYF